MLKHTILIVLIFSALFSSFLAGCDDDPISTETPPVIIGPEPPIGTPDILMANLKTTYEDMDSSRFEGLLNPDFRMILLQSTIDDWANSSTPLEEDFFDHNAEVTIHRNIFEGLGGLDELGRSIPPIDSISVTIMEKNGIWEPVEAADEYFGDFDAYWAQYTLLMHFNKPDASRVEVSQIIDFFVIQDGDENWSLLGIKGYPMGANALPTVTDNVSLGDVLSLYR